MFAPPAQVMFLPCGKSDVAHLVRSDVMCSSFTREAHIIRRSRASRTKCASRSALAEHIVQKKHCFGSAFFGGALNLKYELFEFGLYSNGGGEESRTPVRKHLNATFYGCITPSNLPPRISDARDIPKSNLLCVVGTKVTSDSRSPLHDAPCKAAILFAGTGHPAG